MILACIIDGFKVKNKLNIILSDIHNRIVNNTIKIKPFLK